MLSGMGNIFAKTTSLSGGVAAQKMLELFIVSFNYAPEVDEKEARAFIGGKLQTKAKAEGTITHNLTLSFEYQDWAQLGFVLDQSPRALTNETYPILKRGTVPTSSPYEIADTDITTSNAANIYAYVSDYGTWGQPGSLERAGTPASPTAGEVGIVGASNKLVFNSAQAGAPVTYVVQKSLTSVEAYGGAGTLSRLGQLEFWGMIYSPKSTEGMLINFPIVQRSGRPSLEIADGVPTLEVTFGVVPPSGWEEPYKILNMDTAVI